MSDQRKAFESWVNNPHMIDKSSDPYCLGDYTHPWTVGAWEAWKAAITSQNHIGDNNGMVSTIAAKKIAELRAQGFTDYDATILRNGSAYCIVGSLGDVRWVGQEPESKWVTIHECNLQNNDLIYAKRKYGGVVKARYLWEPGSNPHRVKSEDHGNESINNYTHVMLREPDYLPPAPEGE